MQTSQRGIDLIKQFEGLRLEAYDDGVGIAAKRLLSRAPFGAVAASSTGHPE